MARQPSLLLLDDAFVTFRLRLHIIWLLFMWLGGVDTKREREKFTDDFPRNTFEDKFKGQYSKSCCRSSFRFDLSLVPFILPSIEPDAATIYPHSLSLLLSLVSKLFLALGPDRPSYVVSGLTYETMHFSFQSIFSSV
jgi:hypothetical protein